MNGVQDSSSRTTKWTMSFFGNLYARIYRRIREELFPLTHPFDQANGVETSGRLNLRRLAIHSPNRKYGRDYQGVEPGRFSDALAEIRADFSEFTFIDLGAGKGRALIMAHKLGFRRLIGVEFSSKLAEIARKNLATLALANIQIVDQDAADFCFPGEPLVVFMFNSFGVEVLNRVLANLHAHAYPFFFVYVNPLHNAAVRAHQFLSPVAATRFHSVWYFKPVHLAPGAAHPLEVGSQR